jgi:hypothetical protein
VTRGTNVSLNIYDAFYFNEFRAQFESILVKALCYKPEDRGFETQ